MKLGCFNFSSPNWKVVKIVLFGLPIFCFLLIPSFFLYLITLGAIDCTECTNRCMEWSFEALLESL